MSAKFCQNFVTVSNGECKLNLTYEQMDSIMNQYIVAKQARERKIPRLPRSSSSRQIFMNTLAQMMSEYDWSASYEKQIPQANRIFDYLIANSQKLAYPNDKWRDLRETIWKKCVEFSVLYRKYGYSIHRFVTLAGKVYSEKNFMREIRERESSRLS